MINYFKYYDLEERMDIDPGVLRRKFYENSRKYHPDYFTLENREQQDEVLSLSTINNEAYHTLKDEEKRLKHLLEVYGVIGEDKNEQLPQDFLMEMMEVNETIMDGQLGDLTETRYKEMMHAIEGLSIGIEEEIHKTGSKSELTNVDIMHLKESYYKKKYINRLKENIKKIDQPWQ